MGLGYPDSCAITRTTGETQTPSGGWSTGTPGDVYVGPCDYQDGATRYRNQDGVVMDDGDGRLYLPESAPWNTLRAGDNVLVTFREGDAGSFTVAEADRLDGSCAVRRDTQDTEAP